MKLFITGSTGFLGKHVVSAAIEAGHEVVALVRPKTDVSRLGWEGQRSVTIARGDLRQPAALLPALAGVDSVVHLAAAKEGSFYAQFHGTVVATENLLGVMHEAGVKKLVLTSTFSVYDYTAIRGGSVLTEDSPLEDEPDGRDEYCQTKLIQERLVREAEEAGTVAASILRPGVVYGGSENLWTARLGFKLSAKRWVRTGARLRLPLTYVENCAHAIVAAAETEAAYGKTLNIIDDDRPSTKQYMKRLAKLQDPAPKIVPLNYTLTRFIAWCGVVFNRLFCGGRAKVPSIFRPAALAARCKPLRFDNAAIKQTLGWSPKYDLSQAIARSNSGDCDRAVVLSGDATTDTTPIAGPAKEDAKCA